MNEQGPVAWVWTCDDCDCDDMCFPTCSTQRYTETVLYFRSWKIPHFWNSFRCKSFCTRALLQSSALFQAREWTPTTTIMYYHFMWQPIAGYTSKCRTIMSCCGCYFRPGRSNPKQPSLQTLLEVHEATVLLPLKQLTFRSKCEHSTTPFYNLHQLTALSNRMVPPHNCQPERRISFT